MTRPRRVALVALVALLLGFACSRIPRPATPPPPQVSAARAAELWGDAQAVFDTRCVVCHGCYDAPCQLKLGAYEGVARGASGDKVYDPSRLLAATPTRLGIDAHDAAGWKKLGFHNVLPEGGSGDPRASVLLRMLDLKREHPLPGAADIAASFTLDLDRKETCATLDHFDDYAKKHPLWGMPYALPGLDESQEAALVRWVKAGAPRPEAPPIAAQVSAGVAAWESFLNGADARGQLVGRYLYEHLFLASLYFKGEERTFFRLVRSRTPPGTAVDEIPTRRPFDDPHAARVYYRFERRLERSLDKTQMPYRLDPDRLKRYRELFLGGSYAVDQLPGYEPEVASNPFRAFQAIPVASRYRFLLEEAEFTMMGFIKGPVCRGQVALDVIEDRFWVTFVRPDAPWMSEEANFLAGVAQDLDMPAAAGSTALPTIWLRYGGEHAKYVAKRNEFIARVTAGGEGITPGLIWDGEGANASAALTVFRHFDSATVVKGLVGAPPKTAWVVGYPLLERIHYLLVAGFDVFGNVSHQVTTRLYMDFLRMEGETDFLLLLPPARRRELVDAWYRGVTGKAKDTVVAELAGFAGAPAVSYGSAEPERELFALLEARVAPVRSHAHDLARLHDPGLRAAMERLGRIKGRAASLLPEVSFLVVRGADGTREPLSILRDSAHTNVAHLFQEDQRRVPAEDELTVVAGFLGAYPNALFEVSAKDAGAFVEAVAALGDEGAYGALRQRFGVLRGGDRFWSFSDEINEEHRKRDGVAAGLFDYNRLEGR